MADPLVKRDTDPQTSQAGVQYGSRNRSLKHMVFMSCATLRYEFSDTDLVKQIKIDYFVDVPRNIVARTRLTLEREHKITRRERQPGEPHIKFNMTMNGIMIIKGSRY